MFWEILKYFQYSNTEIFLFRVYGLLYRGFSPARLREAEHYLSLEDWPWRLLPPFLEPHVMAFSQDTLPLILHQATQGRQAIS